MHAVRQKPKRQSARLRRGAWALAGFLWFLWIGYEDRSLIAVSILAASIAFVLAVEAWMRWIEDVVAGSRKVVLTMVLGLGAGTAMGPISVVLAALKISLHQHAILDFSIVDIGLLLSRSPYWMVIGLLAGVAAGLLVLASMDEDADAGTDLCPSRSRRAEGGR
jgi:hypothetical protein